MNLFARLTLDAAYALQASQRYQKTKRFFYNLLENSSYPYKRLFDMLMITLIFISVVILVREVKYSVDDWWLFFNNFIISIIFLIEYLLRMWVYSDTSAIITKQYERDEFLQRRFSLGKALWKISATKLEYMRSPSAIIDLMAIMPFFHQLRMLRMFILFRVFKLFRYTQHLQHFYSVLSSKKFELMTLGIFVAIIVFVSSILIYVMEANNPDSQINTLFEAFYWSLVTISTVGFGDMVPVSDSGRAVAMVIIIAGIAVISFSTSIVVSAFTEKLDDIKEAKIIHDIQRLKHIYLICGYSRIAEQVAAKLHRDGHEVVVLERNEERVKHASDRGLLALKADPGSLESYSRLALDFNPQVRSVLCLDENDVQNVYTALTIRSMNKEVRMLSIAIEDRNRKKLTLAGVDQVVYSQELVGLIAKEYSGKPVAFEVIHALRSENAGVFFEEVLIDSRSAQSTEDVGSLGLENYRLILLGVYKNDIQTFVFKPSDEQALAEDDILLIIGAKSLISEFKLNLHKRKRRT